VAVGQLHPGGQRDRPGSLHLDRAAGAAQAGGLPGLLQRVHVLVEQAGGPARHRARPGGDAVPARHGVDGHVDQQRTGPPEHVGAHSPGRQLDQVGQRARQLTDDHLRRLPRRGAGPRSDAGSRCENTHPATVFDLG
jgi:hypothetical protein